MGRGILRGSVGGGEGDTHHEAILALGVDHILHGSQPAEGKGWMRTRAAETPEKLEGSWSPPPPTGHARPLTCNPRLGTEGVRCATERRRVFAGL